MTRHRYIWDKQLEALVEIGEGSNRELPKARTKGQMGVISDIEPYRAVASDIACEGKRPMIQSRSEHREFLRRNGYVELGNDRPAQSRTELSRTERVQDIKRALGRL